MVVLLFFFFFGGGVLLLSLLSPCCVELGVCFWGVMRSGAQYPLYIDKMKLFHITWLTECINSTMILTRMLWSPQVAKLDNRKLPRLAEKWSGTQPPPLKGTTMLEVHFRSVLYSFHHLILTDSLQALAVPQIPSWTKVIPVFLRNPSCWHTMSNTVTANN